MRDERTDMWLGSSLVPSYHYRLNILTFTLPSLRYDRDENGRKNDDQTRRGA